jgi:glucose/arabinose dehydrogenase
MVSPVIVVAQEQGSIRLEPFLVGLQRPVQVVTSHDGTGRLFVADQEGRVLVAADGQLRARPFLDLTGIVSCCDNGGLLSLVFHPAYASNGRFFVLYVDGNGDTVVAEYHRSASDPDVADPASGRTVLVVDQPAADAPNHHGGTLQFGPDGFFYISIGDGGVAIGVTTRAQDLHLLLGKLLRVDVDHDIPYAIPRDNPFIATPGARPEIWALGLRNPWRFSFDRATGDLTLADVGNDTWEEVDILPLAQSRGANFGWPMTEGKHCFPPGSSCSFAGLTLPVIEYGREGGCAVTGGFRYRGSRLPALAGAYLYGDWCSGMIWAARQTPAGLQSTLVADMPVSVVAFGESDDGELYVVDYLGSIARIEPPLSRHRATRH